MTFNVETPALTQPFLKSFHPRAEQLFKLELYTRNVGLSRELSAVSPPQ